MLGRNCKRVPPERQNIVRKAVGRMHERHGAVVCVVCAAPRMAEELGLDGDEGADDADAAPTRPPRRAAAVTATERAIANQARGDNSDEEGEEHRDEGEGMSLG